MAAVITIIMAFSNLPSEAEKGELRAERNGYVESNWSEIYGTNAPVIDGVTDVKVKDEILEVEVVTPERERKTYTIESNATTNSVINAESDLPDKTVRFSVISIVLLSISGFAIMVIPTLRIGENKK